MITTQRNVPTPWPRRLSLIGLGLLVLIFLGSAAVHIATLLGIHVEFYLPEFWGNMLVFGLLLTSWLVGRYRRRLPSGSVPAIPSVTWVPSPRLRRVLLVIYLAYVFYALWTIAAPWLAGNRLVIDGLQNWRRDAALLMGLSLATLFNLVEYTLGWQLLGPPATGALTAEQKRQWHWYGFGLAGVGFAASAVVYGVSFWGGLPEPLWLVGWFGIAAALLAYLGYLLMPQAPEPYPARAPLPGWVFWAGQFVLIMLLLNIAVSVGMVFFSGGIIGALRITAAIFLLVYFAVARLIAAYRLGWPDLMPPANEQKR